MAIITENSKSNVLKNDSLKMKLFQKIYNLKNVKSQRCLKQNFITSYSFKKKVFNF